MASGSSSGRPNNPGSRSGFDFASDDILSSYDDYENRHESFNGTRSDPAIGTSSTKDFHTTRVSRSSAFPTTNVYAQPEDSLNQELITAVERTVKRNGDNIMRFLEGLSSRLSQLELYCYNLDKSIGDMRSDLAHHNGEADIKLKSMDKHLQEVHRSVQLLRDKQELAETQKELAKLQLAQKESSHSQEEEKSSRSSTGTKNTETGPEMQNQQLALALPHQIAPAPPSRTPDNYLPSPQLPNPAAQPLPPQTSYIPAESQYRPPQMAPNPSQAQVNQPQQQAQQFPQYQQQWLDPFPQAPAQPTQPPPVHSQMQIRSPNPSQAQVNQPQQQSQQAQVNQPPSQSQVNQPQQHAHQFPQYQQQWSDPFPQAPAQPTQPPPPPPPIYSQPQIRAPPQPALYHPPYMQSHQPNQPLQEQMPSSMPLQGPPPGFPQQGVGRAGGSYNMYDGDGPCFSQGVYPPPAVTHQNPPAGHMIRGSTPNNPQQFARNHPYNELIDKAVSMGYRGDHVANVVQRLEESGQPVDFNAVLDRLNAHSSGGSQRSW